MGKGQLGIMNEIFMLQVLTVKIATHTVASMKPLEERNSSSQGFLGEPCSARSVSGPILAIPSVLCKSANSSPLFKSIVQATGGKESLGKLADEELSSDKRYDTKNYFLTKV